MQLKIHKKRLAAALKSKKLIIFQYSCTDIFVKPVKATSFFALNYFTDEEFLLEGNEKDFSSRIKDYFDKRKDYYFILWNFNSIYSYGNLGVGFSERELSNLNDRTIDLDDVFELYAIKKGYNIVEKIKPAFDSRYYFAILNNIEIGEGWLWGGLEKDIKNYAELAKSSRLKAKIAARLLNKYKDNTLKVGSDKKIIKKSMKIIGVWGKIGYWRKYWKPTLIGIVIFLLGLITDFVVNIIANYFSK